MAESPYIPLDAENPWPGLNCFKETDSGFFHGRKRETDDLRRLVKRERLTVLFGRSGLGKTSILQAGLFPRLREDGIVPVYLRLDFSGQAPPLRTQVLSALMAECRARGVEASPSLDGETLWEYFHRREVEFWNEKNRPVIPLLVFDQFEELFTRGAGDESTKFHNQAFIAELGDLIENRIPKPIKAALDHNPQTDLPFDYRKAEFKLILSFREDYLAYVEELKKPIPSITYNRYRLLPMDGRQAGEVVTGSGGHLVEDGVAERIISIAAGSRQAGEAPDGEGSVGLEIDPALLSVICSELNLRRQQAGLPRINQGLLLGAEEQILADFYARSLEGHDPRVRVFIEDQLLTDSGYRDSYALDDALSLPGISPESLDALVAGRLLMVDKRFGVRRLELTHDVLTPVVKQSRNTRKAREAEAAALAREQEAARRVRRNRIVAALLAVGMAGVVGAALLVAELWREVDELNLKTLRGAKSLLTAQAQWFRSKQYDLALLLNVEAYRLGQSQPGISLLDVWGEFATQLLSHAHLDGFLPEQSSLWSVAYSPDGNTLATAGSDGRVGLWDSKTRTLIASLEGHQSSVLAVVFSPDGKKLASAGKDNTVMLWGVDSRKPLFPPLTGHADRIEGLAFSPDGNTLASAGYDGTVRLWEVATGLQREAFARTGASYLGLAFSPTQPRLALACADKTIVLLEADTGQTLATLTGHEDRVLSVAFSPDGSTLASASEDQTVRLWDVASTQAIGIPMDKHQGPVWGLAFSPGGKLLASAGGDRQVIVSVLSADHQPEVLETVVLEGHFGAVRSVAFSPDGRQLVSAGEDHKAILWDLQSNQALTRLETHQGLVWAVAFSPDGKWLASASEAEQVMVWDIAEAKPLRNLPSLQHGPVKAVAYSPDGRRLASASEDKTVMLWDLTGITSAEPSQPMRLAGHDDAVNAVAFSPDGSQLASASSDASVILWEVLQGRQVARWQAQQGGVRSLAFSPDAKWLATGGEDGSIALWDLPTRQRGPVLTGHTQRVNAVAFSPDGQVLASASQDGGLTLWQVRQAQPLASLTGRPGPVRGVAFSPDGRALAATSQDGNLLVFDLATKKLVVALPGHRGRILGLAFSPDGSAIATSGADETIALWNWRPGALAQTACRVANRNLSCAEWADYVGGAYRKTCALPPGPNPPCP